MVVFNAAVDVAETGVAEDLGEEDRVAADLLGAHSSLYYRIDLKARRTGSIKKMMPSLSLVG